jgi:hypothetical protein
MGADERGAASPSPPSHLRSVLRAASTNSSAGDTVRLRGEARCAGIGGEEGGEVGHRAEVATASATARVSPMLHARDAPLL